MGNNDHDQNVRRAHNALLEAAGWAIMLPLNVVILWPLKLLVGLADALSGKSGRPPSQGANNNRNLN